MENENDEQNDLRNPSGNNKKSDRRTAFIFIALFVIFLVVAVVFAGMNISDMRGFETNGRRITATVTGIRTESYVRPGTQRTYQRYYRVFTYELDGETFEAQDGEGWKAYKEEQLGKQIEVYVNYRDPAHARAASNVDLYSVISVLSFAFSLPLLAAGTAILWQKRGKESLCKRLLFVWVAIFVFCVAAVLLFWLGVPNSGFGAVFTRVRGAVGYTVLAGMAAVAAAINALALRKKRG